MGECPRRVTLMSQANHTLPYLCFVATHRLHTEIHQTYFCTFTCHKWLPLIEDADAYESVYRWFAHLKKDDCLLFGYVIMPNHIHAMLHPTQNAKTLNRLVGEGKRFMAYDIISKLKQLVRTDLLARLEVDVDVNERRKGKKHQVFIPSFDARVCDNERSIEQRLEYLHANPIKGKWNLAADYLSYRHSSAAFYETGVDDRNVVTHYKDVGM